MKKIIVTALSLMSMSTFGAECKAVNIGTSNSDCPAILQNLFYTSAKTPSSKLTGRAYMTSYNQNDASYIGPSVKAPRIVITLFGLLIIAAPGTECVDQFSKTCLKKAVNNIFTNWDESECPKREQKYSIDPYSQALATRVSYDDSIESCAPLIEIKQFGDLLIGYSAGEIGPTNGNDQWFVIDSKKDDLGIAVIQ